MTSPQKNDKSNEIASLLTDEEISTCAQISRLKDSNGKHAKALIALNQGQTQVQAAEKSGLSPSQVRYWLAKFRTRRLDIFPESLLSKYSAKNDIPPQKEISAETKKQKLFFWAFNMVFQQTQSQKGFILNDMKLIEK